ncbi:MAG: hypothetical protein ACLUEQ_05570 [Cloacibacillus evryensis]
MLGRRRLAGVLRCRCVDGMGVSFGVSTFAVPFLPAQLLLLRLLLLGLFGDRQLRRYRRRRDLFIDLRTASARSLS